MLFERDYRTLNTDEEIAINKAEKYYSSNKDDIMGGVSGSVLMKYHDMLPNAAYFYKSLFPNNFLDHESCKQKTKLKKVRKDFQQLLDSKITERDILNFINQGRNYQIVGSIFHAGYDFGHHDRYLFKEFELTSTYVADYLLIGKNSHGYHFVFIELENPINQITLKDGELGTTFRKGIKQVEMWNDWIDANYHCLRLVFEKYKSIDRILPEEFTKLDKSRIHYLVIAGRRTDFNDNTYRIKRKLLKSNNIKLLHYDNLLDSYDQLIKYGNY